MQGDYVSHMHEILQLLLVIAGITIDVDIPLRIVINTRPKLRLFHFNYVVLSLAAIRLQFIVMIAVIICVKLGIPI